MFGATALYRGQPVTNVATSSTSAPSQPSSTSAASSRKPCCADCANKGSGSSTRGDSKSGSAAAAVGSGGRVGSGALNDAERRHLEEQIRQEVWLQQQRFVV
jgi:hypothetical protein